MAITSSGAVAIIQIGMGTSAYGYRLCVSKRSESVCGARAKALAALPLLAHLVLQRNERRQLDGLRRLVDDHRRERAALATKRSGVSDNAAAAAAAARARRLLLYL
jgi:hypothetical protein